MTYVEKRSLGRRASDSWSYAGKIIGVIAATIALLVTVGKVFVAGAQVETNTAAIVAVSKRVTQLEKFQVDAHYMTCYLFREQNPRGVPASCDLALARLREP